MILHMSSILYLLFNRIINNDKIQQWSNSRDKRANQKTLLQALHVNLNKYNIGQLLH